MEWIDTHTHLFAEQFDPDLEAVIDSCRQKGLLALLLPNIDAGTVGRMMRLAGRWPGLCYPMMGLHPTSVGADYREQLRVIHGHLMAKPDAYVAIGETGTDLYWDKTYASQMEIAFREQIRWAAELDKPVVIHSRDSLDLNIRIVAESKEKYPHLRGVFHCFNGNLAQAQRITRLGFYLGIGGIITFKNSGMDEMLKELDLAWVVMETDSPYLAPVPYRGQRNSSEYLPLIAQKLAEFRELPLPEIARISTENARQLFRI